MQNNVNNSKIKSWTKTRNMHHQHCSPIPNSWTPKLLHVSLAKCFLYHKIFNVQCCSLASRLLQLSVAYNTLGSQGTTNLITALPSESLRHFNMTSSLGEKGSQSTIQSLVEMMEVRDFKSFEIKYVISCSPVSFYMIVK